MWVWFVLGWEKGEEGCLFLVMNLVMGEVLVCVMSFGVVEVEKVIVVLVVV